MNEFIGGVAVRQMSRILPPSRRPLSSLSLIASSLAAFAFHGHLLSPAPSRHKKAIAMMERNREPAQKEHSAHRHVGLRFNIGESLCWEQCMAKWRAT